MSAVRSPGQGMTGRAEHQPGPRLYEAMNILAMPMEEVEARVQDELSANPLLEAEDAGDEYDEEERDDDEDEEIEDPEDETFDWDDAFFDDADAPPERGVHEAPDYRQSTVAVTRGLHDHLEDQIGLLRLDDRQTAVAGEIVGNIDDDGFLVCTVGVVADSLADLFQPESVQALERREGGKDGACSETETDRLAFALAEEACEEVESVLRIVQSLDPAGVGARDLPECLSIQLRRSGAAGTLAATIVDRRFDAFVERRWTEIAASLGVPLAEVEEAAREIAKLEPKPGRRHDAGAERYVVPDLVLEHAAGEYRVYANDAGRPRLRLARSYVEAAEQGRLTDENKEFVAERMAAATWFLQAIEQRRRTIIELMEFIVDRQRAFFDKGVRHLAPLTMREAADGIGVAESTISRAVNGKYVQSPSGVHSLRYFFSGGFKTISGEPVSGRAIEACIEKLVEDEDPKRPLTDEAIMTLLKSEGIKIARRTVAKYRDSLGIASARMRERP